MDLKTLLSETELLDIFPGRLRRQDLFALSVSEFTNAKDSKPKALFANYVSGLLHYNSNCRFIDVEPLSTAHAGFRSRMITSRASKAKSRLIHPLDLSTLLFLSCDPVARQDIVCRFWNCRHAFPFIVQFEQLTSPKLYIWPFRGLVAKYAEHGPDERAEQEVAQLKFKVVSFLRFSECDISKSDILNSFINRSTKGSSVFFHRNCTGSVEARSEITEGIVEAFPYIYGIQDGGPTLYLNLRGNASNFSTQRNFLTNISNLTVILLESKDIEAVKTVFVGETIKVLLVLDVSVNNDEEFLMSKFPEIEQTPWIHLIPIKDLRLPDIVHELTYLLSKMKDAVFLDSCVAKAKELNIDVDEDDIKEELADAENFSDLIAERYRTECVLFPVQGKEYLEFAHADTEFHKLRFISRSNTVNGYRESLQNDMHKCREAQYRLSLKESLSALLTKRYKNIHFHLFLRSLKLHLEHITRVSVNVLFKEYNALFSAIRTSNRGSSSDNWGLKLKELDERMNSNSLLISDFVREMGQIFEVRKWYENRVLVEVPAMTPAEVETAVCILLEGYPVELMDGRSCSVPLEWIKAVFVELGRVLGKVRVKVISVLGVESSGKSTLLNVMFGCIFPVGSGRCTRGAYMYLQKVIPDSTEVNYILVIDTEGLYSSATYVDEAGVRDKLERELATFVIGLSNITLVNVMEENVDYLKDILPISVYAFLRMNLVGLFPKCKLLHHNVDRSRKHALGHQANVFENELDKYTVEACSLENVQIRKFKEVIQFDPACDVYYFPSLFEATLRETDCQDTISEFYSREAMNLKCELLQDNTSVTINELICNVNRLWNAVKRENFVFEFRNVIDAEARAVLDSKLCGFQWRIRNDIQLKYIKFQELVCKAASKDNLQTLKEQLKTDLESHVQLNREHFLAGFDNLDDTYDTVLAKTLQRLRSSCRRDLLIITNESVQEVLDALERDIQLCEREIKFKQGDRQTEKSVERYIEKHVAVDDHISDDLFDPEKHFEAWACSELTAECTVTEEQMEADAMECLFAIFSTNQAAVDEIRPLGDNDLVTFLPVRDHWPTDTYETWRDERETADQLVKRINDYCSKIMSNIKHRKRFYHRTFFREIALYVKHERQRLGKKLKVNLKFDVQLAAAACSHLIKELRIFDTAKGLISFNMISSIKSFFVSKCLEKKGGITKAELVVTGCCSIIENSIVEQLTASQTDKTTSPLALRIVSFMMDHYSFLRSKLGLTSFVWKQLLLKNDLIQLHDYLVYPSASIKSQISTLFGKDISGIETDVPGDALLLERIIRPLVNEQLEQICQLLLSRSPSEIELSLDSMAKILNFIVSKLEQYVDISGIFKYQYCCVEISDPGVFVQMIVNKLRTDIFRDCLATQLHYTVLEKNMVHDDIRLQVVNSVYVCIFGCEERCRSCGALCGNIQKFHSEKHSALIHMPIGFRDLVSKEGTTVSTAMCFDGGVRHHSLGAESFGIRAESFQSRPVSNQREWLVTCDTSEESNVFWKYMFATHVRELAKKSGKLEPQNIPESWCKITQNEVIHWLDKQINRIPDL